MLQTLTQTLPYIATASASNATCVVVSIDFEDDGVAEAALSTGSAPGEKYKAKVKR